jgi:hypothetical protein
LECLNKMKNILLFIFAIQFGISSAQDEQSPEIIQDIENLNKKESEFKSFNTTTDFEIKK